MGFSFYDDLFAAKNGDINLLKALTKDNLSNLLKCQHFFRQIF